MPVVSRALSKQIFFYGLVGGFGTLCHYFVLLILVEIFGMSVITSSSFGFIIGALVNHELNRKLVFSTTFSQREVTMVRFALVAVLGFFVNYTIMMALINREVHYFISQLSSTVFVFLVTFTLNKIWTFKA